MALNTRPPKARVERSEQEEEAAFERAISRAPDQQAKAAPAAKSKPGPKAGAAYGMGLAAGANRRQLTITLPTEMLGDINEVCQRAHQQRAAFFVAAAQRLLDSDDPTFGKRRK
ncbi:hypothetical protein [Methylorubrum suomiense]|uniref:CopG family transcriptional regulator n=1 Tax=Methylorubrum suomiense TaxID=144191 RepID=A0ABQ4V3C4_9HYPH|nr:hypothetical protein [Methylorubrum suomiense]GJE78069.1 hypothetical protein BGCPKDLD_4680 [Methylorubrum suomiense]